MRRLDLLKRDLELRYDFSPMAAYRSIDRYNDGRINTFNLGTFLRSVGHYASETELLAIVRRIDTDGDAQLSYAEFAEFIRSTNPPIRSVMEVSERAASAERYRRRLLESRNTSPLRPLTSPRPMSATRHSSPLRPSSPYRTRSPVRCCSPEPLPRYTSPSRKPVLPIRDEDDLISGLRTFIQNENDIEREKTSLALKSDFNLTDAFKIFDMPYRGSVCSADLRDGLAAIGVFPTSEELDLFVQRYDTTGDRRLNMREFSDAFLCLDAYYAGMAERRGSNYRYPVYRRDDCFLPDTSAQFQSVWRTHFRCEVSAESVRQRLERNPYFNAYEAFNSLDMNANGAISREEFKRLIQSRGFYVSEKEATEIVEKMDKNKDGRVSFAEVSTNWQGILSEKLIRFSNVTVQPRNEAKKPSKTLNRLSKKLSKFNWRVNIRPMLNSCTQQSSTLKLFVHRDHLNRTGGLDIQISSLTGTDQSRLRKAAHPRFLSLYINCIKNLSRLKLHLYQF